MDGTFIQFTLSSVTAYVVAVAVWPLLRHGAKCNLLGTGLAILGIAACPALISPDNIVGRAFSCLLCIDPLFRVVDYARQLRKGTVIPATWRDYCVFLIPFPFLLTVYGQKKQAARAANLSRSELLRLVSGLSVFATALFLTLQTHQVAAFRESFLFDHLIKMVLFTIGIESVSQVQVAMERLCGFNTAPIIDHAYFARTPAEFWFRYNQRVRQWLYVNVFVPCGGRRSPSTGVVVVFLVSAIFHEFFFALATSRLDGYQFAFFMLQAPAVILSPPLERLARRNLGGRLTAHGITWFWFAVTSPLFFHGLNRVFPFIYASEPWLP